MLVVSNSILTFPQRLHKKMFHILGKIIHRIDIPIHTRNVTPKMGFVVIQPATGYSPYGIVESSPVTGESELCIQKLDHFE